MPAVITFICRKRICRDNFCRVIQLVDVCAPLTDITVHIAYSPMVGVFLKGSDVLNAQERVDVGFTAVEFTLFERLFGAAHITIRREPCLPRIFFGVLAKSRRLGIFDRPLSVHG